MMPQVKTETNVPYCRWAPFDVAQAMLLRQTGLTSLGTGHTHHGQRIRTPRRGRIVIGIVAAPSVLKGVIGAQGFGAFGLLIAQTAPSSEFLQYGATGVVSLSFLYMMYALSRGTIVSRSTEQTEKTLAELAEKALGREAEGLKREEALISMNARLLDMVDRANHPPR